jgi:hypothetical protein
MYKVDGQNIRIITTIDKFYQVVVKFNYNTTTTTMAPVNSISGEY